MNMQDHANGQDTTFSAIQNTGAGKELERGPYRPRPSRVYTQNGPVPCYHAGPAPLPGRRGRSRLRGGDYCWFVNDV